MPAPARHRWRAKLIVATIVAAGLALSVIGAIAWHASAQENQTQAFATSAADVTQSVATLLRRETGLTGTLSTVMTLEPQLSQKRLDNWYTALEGPEIQAGGLGTTVVAAVPAARLESFLARRNREPAFSVLVGTPLPVRRDGRARRCLISNSESLVGALSAEFARAIQGDWCQPSSAIGRTQAAWLGAATDTGLLLAAPAFFDGRHTLALVQAFYRQGAPLSAVAERRAAVDGWMVSSFDIEALLHTALGGRPSLAVAVRRSDAGRAGESVGQAGGGQVHGGLSRTQTINVEGPWTVTVRGTVAPAGLSVGSQTFLSLLIGVLVTLLLGALALVLTRSRESALEMVRLKTGELRHLALHDALTGLPNRTLALDRASQMLARAERHDMPVAAMYLDIDGFKHVNDTFGHAAGDELLRVVSKRLADVIRVGDTAARLGGDEFLLLVEGAGLEAGPEAVAQRIVDALGQPYEPQGAISRRLTVTASIGVATGRRDNAGELVRDADLALYAAKAAGRNRYSLFQSAMQTASEDRLTLELDLAEALEREQLFILYQPTFNLKTERVTGVEALLRWQHPTRGLIQPDMFIPIAEESGLIIPIGRWVLEEACHRAATIHATGRELSMAVNVSARQLESDALIDDVRSALERSGIAPEALTLEITETTLMRDAAATSERLHRLKELGVRIAIDDFGTGYSSLAYLKQFPADGIKIDRAFVREIASSEQSTALLRTLVELGRTLNIDTLAEGIEDAAQLETLQREQCDQGQGFLFSRPLSVEALEEFLGIVGVRAPLPTGR